MKKSDMTAEQFKEIMNKLGKTPTEFAAMIGLSTSCIYYYASGKSQIPYATAELVKRLQA